MATAQQITEPVEVTVYEDKVTGVNLKLSLEEAQYLYDLLGCVAGLGKYRDINDTINNALWSSCKLRYSANTANMKFPFTKDSSISTI